MSEPIKPENIAKAGSEHGEQTALFVWAAYQFPTYPELRLMFAIPNGGLRNKITAANLKAEGVKAHVPDIFLPVARGRWHGLFIEMKKLDGRVDPGQLVMIDALRAQGFGACVCFGWIRARDTLLAYLNYQK